MRKTKRRTIKRKTTKRKTTKRRTTKRKLVSYEKRMIVKNRKKKHRKAPSGLPKIFVINLKRDKEKWKKYQSRFKDGKLSRYSACNGMEVSRANPYYDKLKIMWNAGEKKRKCGAGILNSHMNLIKEIADNQVDQVFVVEDDSVIDFERLKKINLNNLPQDSLIYFGGVLHPPTSFKDKNWKYADAKKGFKNGINVIDSSKYRIFGGFGYYFPKWQIAHHLYYEIFSLKPKLKPLDTEMTYLQKKGIIKYFYYPALSYLHMDDAKKGIHGDAYIKRDMKHY